LARYILTSPIYGCPPSSPSGRKFGTGTTIADTIGNAIAGDVVWSAICQSPSPNSMRPLDAAAAAVMNLPITTLQQIVTNNPSSGGAGLDAGN
jgi:hypothetical protein